MSSREGGDTDADDDSVCSMYLSKRKVEAAAENDKDVSGGNKNSDADTSEKYDPAVAAAAAAAATLAAATAWADAPTSLSPASFSPPYPTSTRVPAASDASVASVASAVVSVASSAGEARRDTLMQVFASLGSLLSLAGFYAVLSAAFALLGMQIYGGRWNDVDPRGPAMPRENFDSFAEAMLTMFTVSTGEGWTDLLYNAMRLEPWITPAFFIVFFVLVNYVLLNLVIAVVLETLELGDDEKRSLQRGEILRRTVARELSDSGEGERGLWRLILV
jgi:hypothetical protein